MRDIISHCRNVTEESLDLVQHSIDQSGQFAERRATLHRQAFVQFARYNALNQLVSLIEPLLRPDAQERAEQGAKAQCRNEPPCHRPLYRVPHLRQFVGVPANNKRLSIFQFACNRTSGLLLAADGIDPYH